MNKIIIAALAILLVSCDKDDNDRRSGTELMSQKPWVLTAYGFDEDGNQQIDAPENGIQACEQDNNYAFNPDGSGIYTDLGLSCGGPDHSEFSWKLLNNNTQLELGFTIISILALDDHQLVVGNKMTNANGDSVLYMNVYRH
jgi:hypothetical protein